MLTMNTDIADRLTNGQLGTVVGFEVNSSNDTGCPKKVHKFKIIYLCSENPQITKLCVICQTRLQLKL